MNKSTLLIALTVIGLTGCVSSNTVPNMIKVSDTGSSYTPEQVHHICYAESFSPGDTSPAPVYQEPTRNSEPVYNTNCTHGRLGTQCVSTPQSYGAEGFGGAFARSFEQGQAREARKPKFNKALYNACLARNGYVVR